jgi:tRNA pseudouridine38-40 synthase
VHACGQAAHVDMTAKIPPVKIMQAMNSMLPPDIRLLQIEKVKNTFHARRNAVSKEYRYLIWNKPVMSPFLCRYRAHIRKSLDVKAMRQAARLLTGKHDFAAFTANPQRIVESTVRTLSLLSVRRKGSEISIIARSDGFLYRMVRSLAGFLIRVGQGDLPPATAARILNKKVRTAVVPTAPPQGLFLWKVNYKNS